jgi:hypothetical protein
MCSRIYVREYEHRVFAVVGWFDVKEAIERTVNPLCDRFNPASFIARFAGFLPAEFVVVHGLWLETNQSARSDRAGISHFE